MPIVKVEWLKGRSLEQREAIAGAITKAFTKEIGLKPEQVIIVFDEISPELQYKGEVSYAKITGKTD